MKCDGQDFRWLALPMFALWLVMQCYSGIWHDAELYSFQAMSHLHPELLGGDLFLRYESQDQFSVFPPVYAYLIGWLGMENAAELLTILMQLLLLFAIWQFAEHLLTRRHAQLALASVLVLPSVYGARDIFHYLESFVTPRMAGEAVALLALASWFAGRRWFAVVMWLGACLLHPLMALAAGVMVTWLLLLRASGRWSVALVVVVGAGLSLAALRTAWRFDEMWLTSIRAGMHYLFLVDWQAPAFDSALSPLLVLACAARLFRGSKAGVAAGAALATGLCGLALTAVGGDLFHLVLVVQVQPWRWMWLSALLAAMLFPTIGIRLWDLGALGRVALLLLGALYLLDQLRTTLILGVLAFAAVWFGTETKVRAFPANYLKLTERGAQALVVIALVLRIANKIIDTRVVGAPGYVPTFFGKVYALTNDGALPALVMLIAITSWYWACRAQHVRWWYAAWAMVVAASLWLSLPSFTNRIFNATAQATFARWRGLIPARTEIFIPEDALAGWTVLLRPSYFTLQQAASELFSRPAVLELRVRGAAASSYLSRHQMQMWPELRMATSAEPALDTLCENTGVRFIVTRSDLHATPLDIMPAGAGSRFAGLKLFACPASAP